MVLAMVFSLGAFGTFSVSAVETDYETSPSLITGIVLTQPTAVASLATYVTFTYTAAAKEPVATAPTITPNLVDTKGLYLDLVTETLINVHVSINGAEAVAIEGFNIGGKWKAGEPSDKDIAGLLKKGGKIILTDHFDAATKLPTVGVTAVAASGTTEAVEKVEGGSLWTLAATVQPAAKAPKYIVDYKLYEDKTGATTGKWTLKEKGKTTALTADQFSKLMVAVSDDGKTPTDLTVETTGTGTAAVDAGENLWGYFPTLPNTDPALNVLPIDGTKATSKTYLVKIAPYVSGDKAYPGTPASKVKVVSQQAAPKLKVDLKKDQIKLKAGQSIFFGTTSTYAAAEGAGADYVITEATAAVGATAAVPGLKATDDFPIADGVINSTSILTATGGFFAAAPNTGVLDFAKGKKDVIDLAGFLGEEETYIFAWTTATDKKPASVKQVIVGPVRQLLGDGELAVDKGKAKAAKTLEFYDTVKKKWGNLPKFEKAGTAQVRLKATKDAAASQVGTLTVAYGVYNPEVDTAKQKRGITAAKYTGPAYDGKLTLTAPGTTTKEGGLYTASTIVAPGTFTLKNAAGGADPTITTDYTILWTLAKKGTGANAGDLAFGGTNSDTSLIPVLTANSTKSDEYTLTGTVSLNTAGANYAKYAKYASISNLVYTVSFKVDAAPPTLKSATSYELDSTGKILTIEMSEDVKGSGADGALQAADVTLTKPLPADNAATVEIVGSKIIIKYTDAIDLNSQTPATNVVEVTLTSGIRDLAGNQVDASGIDIEYKGTKAYTLTGGTTTAAGAAAGNTRVSVLPTKFDASDSTTTFVYVLGSASVTPVGVNVGDTIQGTPLTINTDIPVGSSTYLTIYEVKDGNKIVGLQSISIASTIGT
ncbi:hypothetical protein FACS1894219_06750 [Clostridia bacterium]|nr:hypothetical protein FACS1894219_06750 [Clostridia bacterium]